MGLFAVAVEPKKLELLHELVPKAVVIGLLVNPRNPNPNCPTSDNTGCYFLPGAFAINTTLGTFGTANRRFFHGPGFNNTDFGLSKRTQIPERFSFEFRAEF